MDLTHDSGEAEVVPDVLADLVARALMAREGTAPAWNLQLLEAKLGFARVSMVVRPDMLNGYSTAHGGMIFALADTAFAYACNSRNVGTVAQQASIAFLSPAELGETLVAEAREVALAGRSGVYTVEVRAGDGRTIASFQGVSRIVGGTLVAEESPVG